MKKFQVLTITCKPGELNFQNNLNVLYDKKGLEFIQLISAKHNKKQDMEYMCVFKDINS